MSFRCETCNLTFTSKYTLNKHLETKKHKRNLASETNEDYTCVCGKIYNSRQNRYVHYKKCDVYKEEKSKETEQSAVDKVELKQLRAQVIELLEKNADLQERLDKSVTNNITNNNTTNNNTTNNNTINININAFGNENLDYLTEKKIIRCLEQVYKSLPALLEKIHFDPNHPENHNIKITNKKLPYASIMGKDKKWQLVKRKDAISKMITNGYSLLDDTYRENRSKFKPQKQTNIEKFKDKFEEQEKNTIKTINDDVELLILNKGDNPPVPQAKTGTAR